MNYNCTKCGNKHGPKDRCGHGERVKQNLRNPLARFGFERPTAYPLW